MINKHSKILILFASIFAASSVTLAAVGAHAMHARLLADNQVVTFDKAVDYAMYGGLALLGIAVLNQLLPTIKCFISGYLLLLGTLLFSGSLFLSTMAGLSRITMLTPIGGTLLIIGWLSLGVLVALTKTK